VFKFKYEKEENNYGCEDIEGGLKSNDSNSKKGLNDLILKKSNSNEINKSIIQDGLNDDIDQDKCVN